MIRRALVIIATLALAGCGQSMQRQHKPRVNGTTDAWASGQTARPLPQGVVAQGDAAWRADARTPPKATKALLARGRQRYDIFCSACHGFDGNGHGAVVQRGYPYPGSLNSDAARALPAKAIFDDITSGTGIMYSYASQISPRDRWAIIAYLRALQISQHAPAADLSQMQETQP